MTEAIKFSMKLPAKVSMNAVFGRSFHYKHTTNKKMYLWSFMEVKEKLKAHKFDVPVYIEMSFYFKGRRLDCSNCGYMAKLIEDLIVKHGCIKDDSPKYVTEIGYSSHKSADPFDFVIVEIGPSSL